MFKNKVFKAVISTAMAFMLAASPVCGHAGDIKVMAMETDANGFVIEDGILKKYEGNEAVVTVPNTVTSIGSGAFSNCAGVTNIVIPGTVTNIGERAFYGCSGLQSIELSEGIKSLGKWAFYGCNGLESVVLPEGMESIGELAFYNCTNLGSITIPASVTNIGNSALSVNSTESLVIYGQIGSFAESYANKNKIEFIEVGSDSQVEDTQKDGNTPTAVVAINKSAIKTLEQVSMTSAELTYYKYQNAKGYQIIYATDKNFKKNKKTKYTTSLRYTISGLTTGKTYYVKIRAYKLNSKKSKVFLGKFSTVKKVSISKNFSTSITELKQIGETAIDVSYSKFAKAVGYQITYATNSNFTGNPRKKYTEKLTCTLDQLLDNQTYYVKVRAYKWNEKNKRVFLGQFSDTKAIKLGAYSRNDIQNVQQVGNEKVRVEYSKYADADGYDIRYSTDKDMNKGVMIQNSTKLDCLIKNVEANQTYYFNVQPYQLDEKGNHVYLGNTSEKKSITTAKNPMKVRFKEDSLCYPNYGQRYETMGRYRTNLFKTANKDQAVSMLKGELSGGGGKCYGMSCVFALTKAGKINVEEYFGKDTLYEVGEYNMLPAADSVMFNTTSFYQQSCSLGYCSKGEYGTENIVHALQNTSYPAVIVFDIYIKTYMEENSTEKYEESSSAHAIVGYNITDKEDGYYIDVWDPNSENDYQIYVSKDYKTTKFLDVWKEEGKDADGHRQEIKYSLRNILVLEDSDSTLNKINLSKDFKENGLTSTSALYEPVPASVEESIKDNTKKAQREIEEERKKEEEKKKKRMGTMNLHKMSESKSEETKLSLNYCDFIITSSNGSYAKVKWKEVVEGNLDISYYGLLSFDGPAKYGYYVKTLEEGESYTIQPLKTNLEKYETQYGVKTEEDDFCVSIDSREPLKVIVNSEGNGKTETLNGEKADQSIIIANSKLKNSWFATYIYGDDSGFEINLDEDKLEIASANNTEVDISLVGVANRICFDDIILSSGKIVITQDGSDCILSDNLGNEIARKPLCYSVYFWKTNKECIEKLQEVKAGSTITAPTVSYEGYQLEGWYTSPNFEPNTKWDFDRNVVTDNINLYAKWKKTGTEGDKKNQKKQKGTIAKPAKVTLKNCKKRTIKVTWKKVGGAKGYKVVYSTNRKFAKSKTKTITVKGNKRSTVIKKLKKGKTYYVKVSAYKKDGTKTVYGKYSAVKKVKVKK